MIRIKDFCYWYPGQDQPALDGIDLEIPEGQFCGVVGPNGAGKSTLCYALSGFAPHFFHGTWEGELQVGKRDVPRSTLGELAGEIGLVFQNSFNQISGARFTVREEIAFGLENLGLKRKEIERRVEETLALIDLEALAERSPFALSGGQQQRVAIASILAMQPKLLVLDEPTSQLDPRGTQEVFKILDKLAGRGGTTVVLVEHKLEWLAAFADRVITFSQGRIVLDGSAKKILADEKLLKLGVGQTQFTQAAAAVQKKKFIPRSRPLPVTLKQAQKFFE
ncbi:MAG: energy-coupling factor ABC transporter ATP-binding protein [Chloroflexi bacterium]|nr:energy-coupling factor ABC transporter ATP-binding protein [Chloroflexota bacterium]